MDFDRFTSFTWQKNLKKLFNHKNLALYFRFTFLSVSHVYLETKIQSWYSCFWTLFAVRADFVSFAHWLMATRKEGMSMTLSMPIQWRRHGAMLMIRQMVPDSPFVTRLLYFSATNFIKANSRGYQLAKSSETELRRPLCSSAPDYVKTFFSSRQRDLFGPIRKISWLADIYTAVKSPQWAQYQSCKDICWVVPTFWASFKNS